MTEIAQAKQDPASRALAVLVGAAVVTAVLYAIPYGQYVIYPLMLFSTFAHELGHGIGAWLVGGNFDFFRIWSNGSGVAGHSGHYNGFEMAFISAAGLIGPAVLAGIYFVFGRSAKLSKVGLYILAVFGLIGMVQSLRGDAPDAGFSIVFCAIVAAIAIGLAVKAPASVAQFVVVFLGVQLSLAVFSRGDYLFTAEANTTGGTMPSDTAQMADALVGPYWFWGAIVGLISIAILMAGIYSYVRALRHAPKVGS